MEVTKWVKPSISVSRLPTSYRSNIDEGVVPAPKYLHCQTRLLNDQELELRAQVRSDFALNPVCGERNFWMQRQSAKNRR